KDSDLHIYEYTREETEIEFARPVHPGHEWCDNYITICIPQLEQTHLSSMYHAVLLHNLPWFSFIQKIQNLSGYSQMPMAPPTSSTSVDSALRDLASRFGSGVPRLKIEKFFHHKVSIDHNMFLPPEEPYAGHSSTLKPKALRGNSSSSILKLFLQHFVFLSANNLLSQSQIHNIVEYIVEKGGTIILLFICRLRSPLIAVFARKVFHNALLSGNIYLSRKFIQCGFWLQTDTPSWHQNWTEYLCEAVYSGNEAMVELLCRAGVRPEIKFSSRRPNYWDLKVQVLPTLLAFGADPEKYIKDRETGFPLIDAARSGSLKAVKLLQSKGARVNLYLARYCGTALQAAAS
ncbi:hypothetical protein BO79DRAFT_103907, partial [Aspergillus costaricaensis CBS 115574]